MRGGVSRAIENCSLLWKLRIAHFSGSQRAGSPSPLASFGVCPGVPERSGRAGGRHRGRLDRQPSRLRSRGRNPVLAGHPRSAPQVLVGAHAVVVAGVACNCRMRWDLWNRFGGYAPSRLRISAREMVSWSRRRAISFQKDRLVSIATVSQSAPSTPTTTAIGCPFPRNHHLVVLRRLHHGPNSLLQVAHTDRLHGISSVGLSGGFSRTART